ncbi:MAG: hypothetical protein AAFQ82_24380 [Myxococcota bacterium]
MAKRRWQPPPMNPAPTDEPQAPSVTVDEQVVRNVLKVNPELRDGRTTFQVKKALERGEALHTGGAQPESQPEASTGPKSGEQARQLAETLDFFLSSKGRELNGALEEIDARRRMLDSEEKALRQETLNTLVDFLSMLDAGALALHGKSALQAHREILSRVGVSAEELLGAVKRGGR